MFVNLGIFALDTNDADVLRHTRRMLVDLVNVRKAFCALVSRVTGARKLVCSGRTWDI